VESTPPLAAVPSAAATTEAVTPLDVAVGASALAVRATVVVAREAGSVLGPVARVALDPPGVPAQLRPGRLLADLAHRGGEQRRSAQGHVIRLVDVLVPAVVEEVLRRVDLTGMVTRYVDLDRVVGAVDLDVAVRRLDLTGVVLERVDLDVIVAAVLERLDLVGLATEVIDAIDLPEIIRASTGSMASDTVRGARMRGIAADETVGRVVDRLMMFRGQRSNRPAAQGPADVGIGSAGIPPQRPQAP
jgi:hypothetical protein